MKYREIYETVPTAISSFSNPETTKLMAVLEISPLEFKGWIYYPTYSSIRVTLFQKSSNKQTTRSSWNYLRDSFIKNWKKFMKRAMKLYRNGFETKTKILMGYFSSDSEAITFKTVLTFKNY